MSREYIERENAISARRNDYVKLIDTVKERHGCKEKCSDCDFARDGDSWCNGEVWVVDLLRIPAADVVARGCYDRLLAENDELRKERPVRHGWWIVEDFTGLIKCSNCRNDAPLDTTGGGQYFSPFCQSCGAIMDNGIKLKDGD